MAVPSRFLPFIFPTFLLFCSCSSPAIQEDVCIDVWPDDDSCEVFHVKVPPVFPMLRKDMPDDVRTWYLQQNSICRKQYVGEYRAYLKALSNDSIQVLIRAYRYANNYDPILFNLHFECGRWLTCRLYASDWSEIDWALWGEYRKRKLEAEKPVFDYIGVPYKTLVDFPNLITTCGAIYRIRMINQNQRIGPLEDYLPPSHPMKCTHSVTYCGDAEILTIYKNLKFAEEEGAVYGLKSEVGGSIRLNWQMSLPAPCHYNRVINTKTDSSYLVPGHEYLILMQYSVSGTSSPYEFTLHSSFERFEIDGDYLLDPHRLFDKTDRIPYAEIDSLLKARMKELMGL